jgi:DtxR family manganese transport transcriptional regulator
MALRQGQHDSVRAFAGTRAAHRAERGEDYVEAIDLLIRRDGGARVTSLARHMGVSHVTVSRTLRRLGDAGLVEFVPRGAITLTRQGRVLARRSRARHEVVLAFLLHLGVPLGVALIDSEGLEHHASKATISAMRRALRG